MSDYGNHNIHEPDVRAMGRKCPQCSNTNVALLPAMSSDVYDYLQCMSCLHGWHEVRR